MNNRSTPLLRKVLVALISLVCIGSCSDESSPNDTRIVATGTVVYSGSGEPIENVAISGFVGGRYHGNNGDTYGQEVLLGITNECGRFNITLTDKINDVAAHGQHDTTLVLLRLKRADFGVTELAIPLKDGDHTLTMDYSPVKKPFFNKLFAVLSKDGKSVDIGWNMYALDYYERCSPGSPDFCRHSSDGRFWIRRNHELPYLDTIPILLNVPQIATDHELPEGDIIYQIHVGSPYPIHDIHINRDSTDTIHVVKPFLFPTLNHCN